MIEAIKDTPISISLVIFAVIQMVKIFVKQHQGSDLWRKYREYIPYGILVITGIFMWFLAHYFGYTNDQINNLLQDAYFVGSGSVMFDQLLKPVERRMRTMLGLK
jgi:Mg2+/Co2+ transporter CorB